MHECPTCHAQTPDGHFCVRCGAPQDQPLEQPRDRRQFAGAPRQNRYVPWLVTTLFPQLPRHSQRHFQAALGLGGALVIVLGAFRLFPVALITAAAMMPLLAVLYFQDVDIYEGEPAWALAWTIGWGALTGVGVGLFTKAVAPTGAALIDRGSDAHVITGGILIPALGVIAMLIGPVVLLGHRSFNEALDGATFGAATAAAFSAAEAIVVGVDVLKGGVRPAGAAAPWVARLVAIAVATPVLSMSAIGAAAAALWLRYRAPVTDRRVLGALGSPPLALAAALLLVIAGAIGETFMAAGVWLVWLVVLDMIALVLLRRAVHVGLLEEADEREPGPEIRCANCGAQTASHTFCGNCGVALKALPKGARESAGRRRLIGYGIALAAVVGIGFLVAELTKPTPPPPPCNPHVECGAPPIVSQAIAADALFAFGGYTAWHSSGLGYALRYKNIDWKVGNQTANGVELESADGFSVLLVQGVLSSQASASQLLSGQLSSLSGQLLGLSRDSSPADDLLGTQVGLRSGPGGAYVGTISSPQGPQTPVAIAAQAASDGHVTIVATVIAPGDNDKDRHAVYQRADDVINSIQWGG
jgi:ribosomal protein L32